MDGAYERAVTQSVSPQIFASLAMAGAACSPFFLCEKAMRGRGAAKPENILSVVLSLEAVPKRALWRQFWNSLSHSHKKRQLDIGGSVAFCYTTLNIEQSVALVGFYGFFVEKNHENHDVWAAAPSVCESSVKGLRENFVFLAVSAWQFAR